MTRYAFILGLAVVLAGTGTTGAAEPTELEKLRDTILAREKESWEQLTKKDVAGMKAFYPDDLVMISGDGTRYSKGQLLKVAPDVNISAYKIESNPELLVLGPDAVLLVYRVTYTIGIKDEKPKTVTMLTSSTYVRRDKKWVLVFNQETATK
jgi:hypothetical protein